MTRLRVDLHTHTDHSPDAGMSPERLVECARERRLDRVAVTDHDAIEGALRARDAAPELVIVGEEISCRGRVELIGLFLESRIPSGLPVEEAAARIRDQGGVVYAPHPFAYLIGTDRRSRSALEVADVVEAVNARAFWPDWNRRSGEAVRRTGLPGAAGSDAHFAGEVGRAYTLLPEFRTAAEFLSAVREAESVLRTRTTPLLHVASMAVRAFRYAAPGRRGSKGPRPVTERGGGPAPAGEWSGRPAPPGGRRRVG